MAFAGSLIRSDNLIKRFGTNTNIGAGWTSVPFATLAEGTMDGVSTSDNITFTLDQGLWEVTASLPILSANPIIAALFRGTAVNPFTGTNTEIFSLSSGASVGGGGGATMHALINVTSAASVRCSAFATGTSLIATAPARPRLTLLRR